MLFRSDGGTSVLPTADVVRAALEALSTVGRGNVEVSLDTDTYTIRFVNDLGGTNWSLLGVDTDTLSRSGGSGSVILQASTLRHGALDPSATSTTWNEYQVLSVASFFLIELNRQTASSESG